MQNYQFKAGAGSAEILFPDDMFPTDKLYGVHDAPHARILVLDAGERAAIMALELVNVPDDCIDSIRHIVEETTGTPYDNIWVHATHPITTPHAPGGPNMRPDGTIAGPPPLGAGGPGGKGPNPNGPKRDPDAPRKHRIFTETVLAAAKEAAKQAADEFCEATYRILSGECEVNSSYDIETQYGWWTGINPDGFVNHTMEIVRADRLDGTPIGFLISYAMKSVAIDMADANNPERKVCTDVPGVACRMMEEEYGAPCMFCMAASANQVPREMAFLDVVKEDGTLGRQDLGIEKGYEIVERLGKEMGACAISIARQDAEAVSSSQVSVVGGSIVADLKESLGRPEGPTRSTEYKASGKTEMTADAICLGDLAFVAIKPETSVEVEMNLKEASPFGHTLMLTMVNGGMKYLPDGKAYEKVTWEAQSSLLMPGTAEKWVNRAVDLLNGVKNGTKEPEITLIAEPDAEGQRMNRVVIEFDGEIPDIEKITVENRTITSRKLEGSTLTLELSGADKEASVIPKPEFRPGGWWKKKEPESSQGSEGNKGPNGPQDPTGGKDPGGPAGDPDGGKGPGSPQGPDGGKGPGGPGGPQSPGGPKGPGGPRGPMGGKKRRPLKVEANIPGYHAPIASDKVIQPVIDDFVQGEHKGIPYSLFTPVACDPQKEYPLVIFIPDAGQNGSDPFLALAQGIGATCWAMPEEQKKHPCYVLAIQIPAGVEMTTNEYTVSPEFDIVWELINQIVEEKNIDPKRIYGTGQSQGCMAFCEMNLRHPDFFATSMLVSGHWDIERMAALTQNHFLFGLSEGGKAEYPCFNTITDRYQAQGIDVAKVRLSYRDGWEVNEAKARDAIGDPAARQIVYIIFEEATAFPDDGKARPGILHHQRGWELTYQLEAARDWMFAQHR